MSISVVLGTYIDRRIFRYINGVWTPSTAPDNDGADIMNILRAPNGFLLATSDDNHTYWGSSDNGVTWVGGANSITPFDLIASNGFPIGYDEDGYLYDWAFGTPPGHITKSNDLGVTRSDAYAMSTYAQDHPSEFYQCDATWASKGRVWWNEAYLLGSGRSLPYIVSSDGINVELTAPPDPDIHMGPGTLVLLRGRYDSEIIYVFGDFFNALWWYDPSAITPVLTNVTLPAMSTNSLYSFVPFDDDTWFIAETGDLLNKVWKTSDAGMTWTQVISTDIDYTPGMLFPDSGIGVGINFIDRNPSDHSEMVVVAYGGIYHSTDTGDTWTFVEVPEEFSGVEFSCVQWLSDCTVGAIHGDIYAFIPKDQGDVTPFGGIYIYAQPEGTGELTATIKEIIPISPPLLTNFGTTVNPGLIKLNGGDIYFTLNSDCFGQPDQLYRVGGGLDHPITLVYDFTDNADGDKYAFGLTFDDTGNIYVKLTASNDVDNVVYKIAPDGSLLHRYVMPGVAGDINTYSRLNGTIWLCDDNKTLIYTMGGGFDQFHGPIHVKRWNVVDDRALPDWFDITDPADIPGEQRFFQDEGECFDEGGFTLLPDSSLLIPIASEFFGDHYIGYRRANNVDPAQLYSNGWRPEGQDSDRDPDGSIWISTEECIVPGDYDGERFNGFHKFNAETGEMLKTVYLYDEDGGPEGCVNGYNEIPFCICGGQGGHGNPPPPLPPRKPIAWVGVHA